MIHRHRPFERIVLFGLMIVLGLGIGSPACHGNTAGKEVSSPEVLEQQVTVNLDALESAIDNARAIPAGARKTQTTRTGVAKRLANTPQPQVDPTPAAQPSPRIRVTPVIATPIVPTVDDESQGRHDTGDGADYVRILIFIGSVSTFFVSGGLLMRLKRRRWNFR